MQLLKQLLPGSFEFFLIAVALCVALSFRSSSARRSRWTLAVLTVVYWTLSLPVGGDLAGLGLTAGFPQLRPSSELPVQAIVILDGGTMRFRADTTAFEQMNYAGALRVTEALRIDSILRSKPIILVTSGSYWSSDGQPEGAAIRDALIREGIVSQRVVLDSSSRTTYESAVAIAKQIRGSSCVVLVTSQIHMRRALASFRSQGLNVVPAPAIDPPSGPWWLPSLVSLQRSSQALYEYVALGYYGLGGRTPRPERPLPPACDVVTS